MNRPYSTQEPAEEQINTVSNSKDTLVDDDSQGSNFVLYQNISQISCTAGSSIFKFINQGLTWDGVVDIGDVATITNVTTDVGGVLGSYLNGSYTVQGFFLNSDYEKKGVLLDISINASSSEVVAVTNVQSSYVTPLSIMPSNNLRFFVMNNRVYVRWFDGTNNKYSEITNSAMQQYG